MLIAIPANRELKARRIADDCGAIGISGDEFALFRVIVSPDNRIGVCG